MSISPLVSLSKDLGINFNPNSQKNMLQLAANWQNSTLAAANSEAEVNGEIDLKHCKTAKEV